MLEVIKSRGLPLDRITTTDVWATDTISANLPPLDAFKERMDQRIWDMYRIEVEHLCARNKDGSKKTYEQMFYHVPVRRSQNVQVERERERRSDPRLPRFVEQVVSVRSQADWQSTGSKGPLRDSLQTHGTTGVRNSSCHRDQSKDSPCLGGHGVRGGSSPKFQHQGFPAQISPWCRKLKIDKVKTPIFFDELQSARSEDRSIVEYLGIAADEPKRFGQLNNKKRAPLVEFGIDEDLCGLYCKYNDMLSPSYETSYRDGCWFCHNQGVNQLRLLRRNYPDLWALLMRWDLDSPISFKADGHTVHDFDRRFQLEDERLIDPEKPFRWAMLDAELQYRLF